MDAEVEELDGPFDGPRTLVHTRNETSWRVTPARATAELEARARLHAHPLARVPVTRRGDALVFPRLARTTDGDEPIAAIARGERTTIDATARAFLHELGGPVDAVRALGRIGLSRSRLDRFLDRSLRLVTLRGPDLGGVMPAALRLAGSESTTISLRYGRSVGWPVIDLASLALRAEVDTAPVHRACGGDDVAFDLALLHEALRELAAARDEDRRDELRSIARAIVDRFVPSEPARVRMTVGAPTFLDRSIFAPEGDVESGHARRVLRDWDGLHVGGAIVRVTTDPPIARPPRLFAFEARHERRARLFSRFDRGIRYDDEGLVSATPEAIADRIVSGLSGTVVDATCGIGSIAIALARSTTVRRVIAIDLDADRVAMAAHNADIYGVLDRIDFRIGDAPEIVKTLHDVDALVIDPPWGGRDYDRRSIALDDLSMPIAPLLELSFPIVLKLPRSFDVSTLPAGFAIEPAIDERGVLKMLIARRGVRSLVR
jgi:trimethylguanosine synthase